MFRIKSLVALFSLVIITTIRHGSAKTAYQEECENLMVENFIHNKSILGLLNFKKAFSDLSLKYIENSFKEPQDAEEPIERQNRILKRELWRVYFLDLVADNNINFSSMVSTDEWCRNRVLESMKDYKPFSTTIFNKRHWDCKNSIKEKFDIDDTKTPTDIFEIFYVEWTTEDLIENNSDNDASTSEMFIDELTDRVIIDSLSPKQNYPLDFFQYYEQLLESPNISKKHFFTVEEYCFIFGQETVKNKANYLV